jgi:hypothetical protein
MDSGRGVSRICARSRTHSHSFSRQIGGTNPRDIALVTHVLVATTEADRMSHLSATGASVPDDERIVLFTPFNAVRAGPHK